MLNTQMSSDNCSAISLQTQDLHCCCSITRHEFDANGTTAVHIFNNIVLLPSAMLATLGNLLVLISIWRTPSLHSPSNIFLFSLALSDLGAGLVVMPILFLYNIAKINGLPRVFCNSAVSLNYTGGLFLFASLFTITAISMDMYIALCLHLRYREIVTAKRMTRFLVGIWLCSITTSFIYVFYASILWMLWISLVLLCLLVTAFAYYKVFRIVRHHQQQIDAQTRLGEKPEDQDEDRPSIAQHRKSLVNKFLIYCLMLLCYLPYVVMAIVIFNTSFTATKQALRELSYVILCCNSTLNPFVYCWRFQTIRVAVMDTLQKILRRNNSSQ